MSLAKHTAGQPLTDAERRQRREAARARWKTLAAGTAVGGLSGAVIGAGRQTMTNENRVAAQVRTFATQAAERMDAAESNVRARAAQRAYSIDEAIRWRRRGTPETQRERQARFEQTLESARRPDMAHRLPPRPPVIGTSANTLIYDYEIHHRNRALRREQRYLDRLEAQEKAHFDTGEGQPVEPRVLRNARTVVSRIKADIARLQELKDKRSSTIARAAHERRARRTASARPGPAPVQQIDASVVRQNRGGETLAQVERRIRAARAELGARQQRMLGLLERRTERLVQAARTNVLTETEAAVREAYQRGTYGRVLLHSGVRGAAVGAVAGLSLAGLALLAHHVTNVRPRQRRQALAKQSDRNPEDQIGQGVAETFRAWIDRLLGKTEKPMNIGDDLVANVAPGIVQAFAEGATTPPIAPIPTLPGPTPGGYHVDVAFDRLNPAVRRHMAEYALNRIVAITDQQREAIRTALMDQSVLQGIGPIEVARTIRESIGLTPYQQGVVRRYRADLTDLKESALDRKLRDRRFDRTVRKAIDTGTPLSAKQIDKMVDAYHRRMLAMRAETIARTEAIRATSYGAVARAQDVLDRYPDLDVIKRWIATDDDRTRDTHRDLNNTEVQGMETPFITTKGNALRWPVDDKGVADEVIRCRCAIGFKFVRKTGRLQAVAA